MKWSIKRFIKFNSIINTHLYHHSSPSPQIFSTLARRALLYIPARASLARSTSLLLWTPVTACCQEAGATLRTSPITAPEGSQVISQKLPLMSAGKETFSIFY